MAFFTRARIKFHNYIESRENSFWGGVGNGIGVMISGAFVGAAISGPLALIAFLAFTISYAAALAPFAVVSLLLALSTPRQRQVIVSMGRKLASNALRVSIAFGQLISLVLEWATKPVALIISLCLSPVDRQEQEVNAETDGTELSSVAQSESLPPEAEGGSNNLIQAAPSSEEQPGLNKSTLQIRQRLLTGADSSCGSAMSHRPSSPAISTQQNNVVAPVSEEQRDLQEQCSSFSAMT